VLGPMPATQMFQLSKLGTADEGVVRLLEFAGYPRISRWLQFPTARVVFLARTVISDGGSLRSQEPTVRCDRTRRRTDGPI
jgi:hypothetical protein